MLAEWDSEDGWERLSRAIDVGSKWALVLAGLAMGFLAIYHAL